MSGETPGLGPDSQRFPEPLVAGEVGHQPGQSPLSHLDNFVADVAGRQGQLSQGLDERNLAELTEGLQFASTAHERLAQMPPDTQRAVGTAASEMAERYLDAGDFIQFKKLFKNAVEYIASGRIQPEEGGYRIEGLHDVHHLVVEESGEMSCDCDLFNGRGKFEGQAGTCSHMQTADLYRLAESHREGDNG